MGPARLRSGGVHRVPTAEAFDFDRIAKGVAEKHRPLFAGFAFKAHLRWQHAATSGDRRHVGAKPVPISENKAITRAARHAEELGFAGVWVSDHIVMPASIDSRYPFAADGKATWSSVSTTRAKRS